MRSIRWQLLIAIGGLILVIGLLLGQTPDLETATPQPVRGGSYTEALIGSLGRLNPVLDTFNQADRDVDRLIYTGLVRFDGNGVPQPDLAESWAVSADASLYTVTLRSDAVWHDGAPVTADDVVYTYSKLQDQDYPGLEDLAALWRQVHVVRLDEHTVQFQLPEPFAPFFDYLSIGLLPDHLLRGVSAAELIDHPFNLQPVGTGPFRFDRFLTEDGEIVGVSLTAFDAFYGARPFLERVEFRYFPDEGAAMDAYLTGEAHGVSSIGIGALAEALALPQLNLHTAALPRVSLVFLNHANQETPFFGEKAVRQALLMAVNRQWIVDEILGGQGIVAAGPVLPSSWAFVPDLQPAPFDLEAAGSLLDQAGWTLPVGAVPGSPEYLRVKDEQPLSFELVLPDNARHRAIGGALQQSWASVGIQVQLTPVSQAILLDEYLVPREYQAALVDLDLSRYPDPDPYPFWHDSQAESGQNYGGYEDRNTSIWLEQARTSPDMGRRAELYRSFQRRFQDQVPALLLFYPVYTFGIDADIQGVSSGPLVDPSDRFATITQWYRLARRGQAEATEPTP